MDKPSLEVVLDGDGSAKHWLDGRIIHHVTHFTITALDGGMSSGKPSVAILIDLPSGESVFAETSLALLLTAADAIKARHGDPR